MPRWLAHTIVVVLLAALIALAFSRVNYAWNWAGVWEYRQKLLQGFDIYAPDSLQQHMFRA